MGHDLVVRGGLVVDGTGSPPRLGDVAVDGPIITEVAEPGQAAGGRREIDAEGRLVLPGWVDIHTHYDGQATWDTELAPSSWHGVTTAVFGNCSVGFAPLAPGTEDFLINLMEGVEDIPGSVLSEGIDFEWESFPRYLDALESRRRTMDIGAQIPHAALRFYVMGERGADHAQRATPDEIATMGALTVEGLEAGAFGFTTSRTRKHRAADGRYTPSLSAADSELLGIAQAMGEAGLGVLQANADFDTPAELALLLQMAEVSGRPLSFSLIQVDERPHAWREMLDEVAQANRRGLHVRGQVASRPIGVVFGFTASGHPFIAHRTYQELAALPTAERLTALARPDIRDRMLEEQPDGAFADWMNHALTKTFELGDPPDYEQPLDQAVAARAERERRTPGDLAYELLCRDGGHALLYYPFENYAEGNLDAVEAMLSSPHTVSGLSDGGAHVGTICDASFPTYLLTHWVRDRTRGPRLPLEFVVHRQTQATAATVGLRDRGVIDSGFRADLNVVGLDDLRLHPPEMVHDLPAGGQRLVQRVEGYRHTFVAGTETYAEGEATGAEPGRLVRGPQPAP
jgi:N-acyl-D-aspartate/D-glutamate deacylase